MKNMIYAFIALIAGVSPLSVISQTYVYHLKMTLKVPRVFDNTQSLGYRKNQKQKLVAYVRVDKSDLENGEPRMEVYDCYNKTHKVKGANVTYKDTQAEGVIWRYIGSNKTGRFRNANIMFVLDLNPSYNIGGDEPDNTLIITLSGCGATDNAISGKVTGQMGCGCAVYGHVSPTRTIDCQVSDIVPLSGTFTMTRVKSCE